MAIAFDSSKNCGDNGGAGSLSTAFNNAAGNVMVVIVIGDSTGGADDVNAPTYNGVTMTFLDSQNNAGAFNNRIAYSYILLSPATGSNTLAVTSSTSHYLMMVVATYSGAATSGQPDAHSSSNSGANSASYASSLTTVADNCWEVVGATQNGSAGAGTGFTQRVVGSFSNLQLGDSNGVIHPAGSHSMTTTAGGGSWIFHLKLSIAPPAAVGAFTPAHLLHESGRYNLRHRQPQGREWARRDRIFIPRHLAEGEALVKAA